MSEKPKKDNQICPKHKNPVIYINDSFFFNKPIHCCKDCLDDTFKIIKKIFKKFDVDAVKYF